MSVGKNIIDMEGAFTKRARHVAHIGSLRTNTAFKKIKTASSQAFSTAYHAIQKGPRTPVAEIVTSVGLGPQIQQPPFNYEILTLIAKNHWLLRMIYRAIQQEAIGPRWYIKARFAVKCMNKECNATYQKPVSKCKYCGEIKLRPPDRAEELKLEAFLKHPNPEYGFFEMLKSVVFWDQMVGDYYLHIAYQGVPNIERNTVEYRGKEVYVEDARYMRPVADEFGKLGNNEYFCPDCYDPVQDNYVLASDLTAFGSTRCGCGGAFRQTCYVQELNGKVQGRFDKNEIVHGSSTRIAPELFGYSKVLSLWKNLLTVDAMDMYNYEAYSEGRVSNIIGIEGYEREQDMDYLEEVIKQKLQQPSIDPITGLPTKSKTMKVMAMPIAGEMKQIKVMPDLEDMQSEKFYKGYKEAVGSVFGVTPVFVSVIESGKTGNNPRMQIDVQNRTTREVQAHIEETINEQVLLLMGINDWLFKFNPIEAENELLTAQVSETRGRAAQTWITAGFDVDIGEDGDLVISRPKRWNPYQTAKELRASPNSTNEMERKYSSQEAEAIRNAQLVDDNKKALGRE